MPSSCNNLGGRRHRTKKHRRSRHRKLRGGEHPSFAGVETYPGGHVDLRAGATFSGTEFKGASYTPAGGRRRRTRRKHRKGRRSMRGGDASSPMGGDGRGGVTSAFMKPIGGTAWPIAEHSGATTR
jgi:hypothetical protein